MVRIRFSTAPVTFVPRYGHIRTSKFGVGLSERRSNFTLFASKTGGSDHVRMGLFVSILRYHIFDMLMGSGVMAERLDTSIKIFCLGLFCSFCLLHTSIKNS